MCHKTHNTHLNAFQSSFNIAIHLHPLYHCYSYSITNTRVSIVGIKMPLSLMFVPVNVFLLLIHVVMKNMWNSTDSSFSIIFPLSFWHKDPSKHPVSTNHTNMNLLKSHMSALRIATVKHVKTEPVTIARKNWVTIIYYNSFDLGTRALQFQLKFTSWKINYS